MARVVLEHLTKIFRGAKGQDVRALDDASIAISDGELFVLVGPSGCGKTTTLRLIAGLEEITSGKLIVDDQVMNEVSAKDRDIAMVFQHHALYPHLSVIENLAFGLKARALTKDEINRRVNDVVQLLGLDDCIHRRPEELSGGQRQRVAVGRAITVRPRLFLFDEPLSNLDLPMRSQMRGEIRKLHARLGTTMIHVTHDQAEAMTLGQRIAVLCGGKIQQVGEPMQIYRNPTNLFVAGFFGTPPMNLFCGTLQSNGTRTFFEKPFSRAEGESSAPWRLPVDERRAAQFQAHTGKEIVMGLRPEHIRLGRTANTATPNALVEGTVEICEPLGSETHIHVTNGADKFIVRAAPEEKPAAGERIAMTFSMADAVFFDAKTGMAL